MVINCTATIKYCVPIEQVTTLHMDKLSETLAYLIASYFIFNIAYPRRFYPFLLFLQHAVMELKDSQPVPVDLVSRLL